MQDLKEDVDHTLYIIYSFEHHSTKYKKLKGKQNRFSKVCIDAAAMGEVSAMYLLVYITSERNTVFIACKMDVFGSENQFLKVMGEPACPMCGNSLIVEDNMSL